MGLGKIGMQVAKYAGKNAGRLPELAERYLEKDQFSPLAWAALAVVGVAIAIELLTDEKPDA